MNNTVAARFSAALKITPSLAEKLAKAGVRNDQDILLHMPLRYEDETRITPVSGLRLGEFAQAQVTVIEHEVKFRPRRQLVVTTQDAAGEVLVLRYVNFYSSQLAAFKPGQLLRVKGEARHGFFGTEMIHPRVEKVSEHTPVAQTLTPIYPTVEGLTQPTWRKLIERALATVALPEILPAHVLQPEWGSLQDAVRLLHAPPPDVHPHALIEREHTAWARIKFEELLAQQLSLRQARAARLQEVAPSLPDNELVQRFLAQLSFTLTGAQQRAWASIRDDVQQNLPMHRLLQGDVGSGKTVVAGLACAQCVGAGLQAAVMAPTEILAEQTCPDGWRAGTLFVKTTSSVWVQQLHFMKEDIRKKINDLAGKTVVREIHFTVGYSPARKGAGRRAVPPKLMLKERDKRIIAECTETLKDRELAEIVQRVMQAEISRRRLREERQGR